ncbi:MAG TPA: FxLYD domain-containing protein [Acidobacteriota bacterium]|nr:FxLYD domain-containing protein [Acidobacteriota bacterium]
MVRKLPRQSARFHETFRAHNLWVERAKFVSELFEIDKPFRGVLVLESQQPFAAVGLRLGAGLLSTIPVLDLTDRPAPAANPSLILRRDSVYVERSRSSDDVTVNGAVWNKDLNDVCAVNLAVSALDDRGYFLGGSTTSLLGTNRKVGPSSTSYSCLQPGQTGYFSVVFPAGGEVAEVSVFPVGWIQPTSDPKSRLSVTSFSLARPPWFVTRGTTVKGTVANEGTEGAKWIWIDVIFLDSEGRVLGVQSVIPYDRELDPNQSSRFEVTSTVALDQVDRVDFRLRWSDLSD